MIWQALFQRRLIWEWHFSPSHSALKGFHQSPSSKGWSPTQSKEKEEDESKREREECRGVSEGRKRTEWERKRAAWHLRHHINSLNRCDIIIKLAVGSLFSSGPSLVLALSTKQLAILQASFQMLREMMTDIKRLRRKKSNQSYMKTH